MSPVLTASCKDSVSNQCDRGNNDTLWHHKGHFYPSKCVSWHTLSEKWSNTRSKTDFSHPCILEHWRVWYYCKHDTGWVDLVSRGTFQQPQRSEITRGYQMIIGHYSSPFRLRSACHLALVVMLMRGIPSLSPHAPCLTFMGLKSSEWWSASVWDSKLHRFNWEESSPWVCWEVPVGWPWTEQHVVHPYKKKKKGKIWSYFPLYDAEINLSAKLAHKSHFPLCKILFYLTLCHISSFYSL